MKREWLLTNKFNLRSIIIYLILLLAFSLRIYGIQFGLPHIYNPDEHLFIDPAVNMVTTGDLNPHWFGHPGSTLIYILGFFYSIYFIAGRCLGIFPNIHAFVNLFNTNPTSFYLIGRTVTVLFGVTTVYLVYLISKKLFNEKTGLIAALFLSISYLHSGHSQLVRTDIISTFFMMLSFLYCIDIFQKGKLKHYLLAGLMGGFAIAAKYVSVMILAAILFAHILYTKDHPSVDKKKISLFLKFCALILILISGFIGVDYLVFNGQFFMNSAFLHHMITQHFSDDGVMNENTLRFIQSVKAFISLGSVAFFLLLILCVISNKVRFFVLEILDKKFISSLFAMLIGFVIFAPFFFLDINTALHHIVNEARGTHLGAESLGVFGNFRWYLFYVLPLGMGIQIEILSALGVGLILVRRRTSEWLLLSFPLLFFIFIGFGKLRWDRWIIPILPFLAIFAAFALILFLKRICQYRIFQNKFRFLLPIIALLLSLNLILRVYQNDVCISRKDTRTLCKEWVDINIPSGSKIAREWYTAPLESETYDILHKFTLSDMPLQDYKTEGFQYILVSSWLYRRYFRNQEKYDSNVAFYASLFDHEKLIHEVVQEPGYRPGPTVRIYQLNPIDELRQPIESPK